MRRHADVERDRLAALAPAALARDDHRAEIGRALGEHVGDGVSEDLIAVEVEEVGEARHRRADEASVLHAALEQLVDVGADGAEAVAALEVAGAGALREQRGPVRGILTVIHKLSAAEGTSIPFDAKAVVAPPVGASAQTTPPVLSSRVARDGGTSVALVALLRQLVREEVQACLVGQPSAALDSIAPIRTEDTRSAETAEQREMDDVIGVVELARLLNIERKTVYNLIQLGQIPGVRRFGRRIRIHRATVLSWLRSGQGSVPRSRRTL